LIIVMTTVWQCISCVPARRVEDEFRGNDLDGSGSGKPSCTRIILMNCAVPTAARLQYCTEILCPELMCTPILLLAERPTHLLIHYRRILTPLWRARLRFYRRGLDPDTGGLAIIESKSSLQMGDVSFLYIPNIPPPPPPACRPAASPCIFSDTLTLTSKNLATHRSRHTLSPLFKSASR